MSSTSENLKDSSSSNKNTNVSKKAPKSTAKQGKPILSNPVRFPLWLSVSEAAKLGGVNSKTIRRALQTNQLAYKIINNRYLIKFSSVIKFLYTKTKLKNKLNQLGVGQYIEKWRE